MPDTLFHFHFDKLQLNQLSQHTSRNTPLQIGTMATTKEGENEPLTILYSMHSPANLTQSTGIAQQFLDEFKSKDLCEASVFYFAGDDRSVSEPKDFKGCTSPSPAALIAKLKETDTVLVDDKFEYSRINMQRTVFGHFFELASPPNHERTSTSSI